MEDIDKQNLLEPADDPRMVDSSLEMMDTQAVAQQELDKKYPDDVPAKYPRSR